MVKSGSTAGSASGTSSTSSSRGSQVKPNDTQGSFSVELSTTLNKPPPRRLSKIKIPTRPFWVKYSALPGSPSLFTNPATATRRRLIYTATFFSLCSLTFTILVLLGNIYNKPILTKIYFLKLDLSNLIPTHVPNYGLINSIAQSLGLRDFYQVGLWGYCEGYNDLGVTWCTKPKHWYWFDPVEIITQQLLKGAKIALPQDIARPLELAKAASYWMFVSWITGVGFTFLAVCSSWVAIYSHWAAGYTGGVAGIAMAATTIAATLATTIYSLFRSTFEKAPGVSVSGILGREMFVFMWLAAGFGMAAFVLHCVMCFCVRTEKESRKKREAEAEAGKREEMREVEMGGLEKVMREGRGWY